MSKKLQKRENSKKNLKTLKATIAKVDSKKKDAPKKESKVAFYFLWTSFLSFYAYMMYRLFVR
tara:strand:- start:60 stop:248 length:189 start_codon:yes stop_codon:yes gene_type:complete